MLQIKNTLGGGKPEGLYVWKKYEIGSELKEINKSVSTLPYEFYQGSAVMLNGEIHILGGGANSTSRKKHYKWDGSSWTSVSTLPYSFNNGSVVVLNGEIHILGSDLSGAYTNHYKFDGSSWSSVSTLPYNFYGGSAVVLNNEIHILGSNFNSSVRKNHYKWDGSSWTSVSTLPYNFYYGSAVVLNGEIHILGSNYNSSTYTNHYKFDGSSWTSVSTLPYIFYGGSAVVLNNEIHILGGSNSSLPSYTAHYKFEDTSWTSVSTLPYDLYNGSAVVLDNSIYILGSGNSSYYTAHYLVCSYNTIYTFLDYIVSDKENAYPNGGEKGGYWYERVSEGITPEMFGCIEMAVDTFTVTANTTGNSYTISHSLGTIPIYFIIIGDINSNVTNGIYSVMAANHNLSDIVSYANVSYWDNSKISTSNANISSISTTGFKVNNPSFRFVANAKYTVITLI